MKKYHLVLKADVSKTFHAQLAAQSLDINTDEKSTHEFAVEADLDSPFKIGLIVGASGSGKTTFARHAFGDDCFKTYLDKSKAVIDQFPATMEYQARAAALMGIGLSQVPCWIKPAGTLSNGQQARAEAALAMCYGEGTDIIVIDEWTSVVDRTVAKAMSHCVQKYARKTDRRIVLLSCHYDVIEWLDPDWILDCNSQRFIDRRLLRPEERRRKEQLTFDIREVTRDSWPRFSQYHYLSKNLPGGKVFFFGLFHGEEQIGFQCFANYVPMRPGDDKMILHSNRTVIHPDWVGLGLGIKLIDESSRLVSRAGYRVRATFSSEPVYRSMAKSPNWRFVGVQRKIGERSIAKSTLGSKDAMRRDVKVYNFEFIGA